MDRSLIADPFAFETAPAPRMEPEKDNRASPEKSGKANMTKSVNIAMQVRESGATTPLDSRLLRGSSLDRAQLEHVAKGKISDVFGPLFTRQDGYVKQCRMPMPPLLLADRVLGIDGEAGSMDTGTIWTETEVGPEAWYLHRSRMPIGLVIESGQADLLLISWLGVDFFNAGSRVYRLLGCEITFHDCYMPQPGDIIRFQINITGHANLSDTRLFFFNYD